jgi:hypothetical protein
VGPGEESGVRITSELARIFTTENEMKLGSREADEAYDRWHDRMADEYFGANEDEACEICGGDQDAMNELAADAERFRALRELSAQFAARYAKGKADGVDLDDVVITDLPSIAGIVMVLGAADFTAAVDELMRSNLNSPTPTVG